MFFTFVISLTLMILSRAHLSRSFFFVTHWSFQSSLGATQKLACLKREIAHASSPPTRLHDPCLHRSVCWRTKTKPNIFVQCAFPFMLGEGGGHSYTKEIRLVFQFVSQFSSFFFSPQTVRRKRLYIFQPLSVSLLANPCHRTQNSSTIMCFGIRYSQDQIQSKPNSGLLS